MKEVLTAVAVLSSLGLVFGVLLGFASKVFEVKQNPLVGDVLMVLPGVNCGGCGYAGCEQYAIAVADNGEVPTLCSVGGSPVALKIGDIMGVKVSATEKMVAYVKCNGDCDKAKQLYEYHGIMDCTSAAALPGGGAKSCSYGCLGLGTCVKACEFDAIRIIDGIAIIDESKCTNCGACMKVCPKNLIESVPENSRVRVACNSKDSAKDTMGSCKVGCIACKKCEKACEFDAVHVNDSLSKIDYSKCTQCKACVKACPTASIEDIFEISKVDKKSKATA
ncbi:RnfABCDGE type electron transport complex subunit B [Youngiibacter fragilis]|uniref:Ion-translocating oxidoreductase complex subunit B n=1 Tax=Youngiibacter fragilis 232.1 TaxID=994573 RepID=V7I965_9CLOT|nr:RnfABCDGE type electron transport complex subunit B [Youngiibacter fragilis]ETA81796.1 ferredoxin [Youngiibacter fragilis 232.1]